MLLFRRGVFYMNLRNGNKLFGLLILGTFLYYMFTSSFPYSIYIGGIFILAILKYIKIINFTDDFKVHCYRYMTIVCLFFIYAMFSNIAYPSKYVFEKSLEITIIYFIVSVVEQATYNKNSSF